METFFYIIGFIIAICIVIYVVDITHRMKDSNVLPFTKSNGNAGANNPKVAREIYHYPRTKICPCCGAHLEQYDALFASMDEEKNSEGKHRVFIHGCRYCHKKDGIPLKSKIEI